MESKYCLTTPLALLVVFTSGVYASCDSSKYDTSNSSFKIATHCMGHGSDPVECRELGEGYGYDACTPQTVKDLCPAMCYRCPISAGLWSFFIFMILVTIAFVFLFWRRKWLHFGNATQSLLTGRKIDGSSTMKARIVYGTRLFTFNYMLAIMIYNLVRGYPQHWSFTYFTIWNYTTMILVFFLLSLQSVLHAVELPRWLTCFTWTIFQVEMTNALLLDVVFWTVLYDGCGVEFTMVNVHAVNSVFILTEFFLNEIVYVKGQVIFVIIYALVYTIVTWILYYHGYNTPYPFLRVGPDTSYLWYAGLMAGLVFFFFLCYGLSMFKKRFLMKTVHRHAPLDASNTNWD